MLSPFGFLRKLMLGWTSDIFGGDKNMVSESVGTSLASCNGDLCTFCASFIMIVCSRILEPFVFFHAMY